MALGGHAAAVTPMARSEFESKEEIMHPNPWIVEFARREEQEREQRAMQRADRDVVVARQVTQPPVLSPRLRAIGRMSRHEVSANGIGPEASAEVAPHKEAAYKFILGRTGDLLLVIGAWLKAQAQPTDYEHA
jgi:hypothetical protein